MTRTTQEKLPTSGGSTITGLDTQVLFFDGDDNPAGDGHFTWDNEEKQLSIGDTNDKIRIFGSGIENAGSNNQRPFLRLTNSGFLGFDDSPGDTDDGGSWIIRANDGGSTSGKGGDVTFSGGDAQGGDSNGGNFEGNAGEASGSGIPGYARLLGGGIGNAMGLFKSARIFLGFDDGGAAIVMGDDSVSTNGLKLRSESGGFYANLDTSLLTGDRTLQTPDESGILALISDLSSYQPLDATLTSLAAYNTNGILTQTAADTFTGRTITGTSNQVIVTNGNGVSGNPTLSLPQSIATNSAVQFGTLGLGILGYSTAQLAIVGQDSANDPGIVMFDSNFNQVFQITNIGNAYFFGPPTVSSPDSRNSPGFNFVSTFNSGSGSTNETFTFQSIRWGNGAGQAVIQFRDNSANTILSLGDGTQSAAIGYGFANNPASLGQLHVRSVNASYPGIVVQTAASQTANLQNWQDSSATVLAAVTKNGAFQPASLADSAAANNSLYYSTDASKLVYKDSGSTVHNLY